MKLLDNKEPWSLQNDLPKSGLPGKRVMTSVFDEHAIHAFFCTLFDT